VIVHTNTHHPSLYGLTRLPVETRFIPSTLDRRCRPRRTSLSNKTK